MLFHLNEADWSQDAGFAQNRASIAMGVAVTDSLKLEAGYMNQLSPVKNGPDRMNHNLLASLSYRFN